MKIRYDKETDIVYIIFSSQKVAESDQDKPGIIIDYSADGQIVGIEVLNASEKMDADKGILYEVAWAQKNISRRYKVTQSNTEFIIE